MGDNQAKAANADIGLRKQRTQALRQTGGRTPSAPRLMEVSQKTEAKVDRETPTVNTKTSEGACKT